MQRDLILTKDGSHTIMVQDMNATYHSVHGAIQESMHVFIEAGLYGSGRFDRPDPIIIFEMGLGTGLNALLSLIEAEKFHPPIHYTAIELFPLDKEDAYTLNYCGQLKRPDLQPLFEQLHQCEWEKDIVIASYFTFHKTKSDLINYSTNQLFDLIYFDAFAPTAQPELWTKQVYEKLYSMMSTGGMLVTYCSKGSVRRPMQDAGFSIEKLSGPPGKREMIRAVKPVN